MKKYFAILELDESASIEAVERAYKQLSDAWRPENYQNLPRFRRKAEIKLAEINDAYEQLKAYLGAKPPPADQNDRPAPEPAPSVIESRPELLKSEMALAQPANGLSEPETEPTPVRPDDHPPWEPTRPSHPADETGRPQIQKTAQKSLVFGFVAILAVLVVLLLYRGFGRQKVPEPSPQTRIIQKTQPAPKPADQPAVASGPKAALAPKSQTPVIAKPQPALKATRQPTAEAPKTTATASVPEQPPAFSAQTPKGTDYQEALSEEVLSPYNRNPARVRKIQKSLTANGYDTGPIDGIIGPHTSGALQQFAGDHNISSNTLFAPNLADATLLYAEIAAEHPNWHQVIGSDDFARWLNNQTYYRADRIQTLKKSATARQVNDIIALYKLERNMPSD